LPLWIVGGKHRVRDAPLNVELFGHVFAARNFAS
jgi:hypothetical protein